MKLLKVKKHYFSLWNTRPVFTQWGKTKKTVIWGFLENYDVFHSFRCVPIQHTHVSDSRVPFSVNISMTNLTWPNKATGELRWLDPPWIKFWMNLLLTTSGHDSNYFNKQLPNQNWKHVSSFTLYIFLGLISSPRSNSFKICLLHEWQKADFLRSE